MSDCSFFSSEKLCASGLKNFSGYEKWFAGQISRIRKLCPGAAVIVIGVADMSVKNKNNYITNPNVEKVRDALKTAAFSSGAAFWDMYSAMGGENSMPAWVTEILPSPPMILSILTPGRRPWRNACLHPGLP
jgi:hypothetical protein